MGIGLRNSNMRQDAVVIRARALPQPMTPEITLATPGLQIVAVIIAITIVRIIEITIVKIIVKIIVIIIVVAIVVVMIILVPAWV